MAKQEVTKLWKQHHNAVLNKACAANQWKRSQAITHLICAEQNHRCYIAFHKYTRPKSLGGLAYLTTNLTSQQQPTMILEPEDMNNTLLDYSQTHFAWAKGSPFMVDHCSTFCTAMASHHLAM